MSTQAMQQRPTRTQPPAGLTMIELLVTLAITAILIAVAVPSMREFMEKKRVEGVANEMATDLRYLRSLSMQTNNAMLMSFNKSSTQSCYSLISTGGGTGICDCSRAPAAVCDAVVGADTEVKSVYFPSTGSVSIESNQANYQLSGNGGMTSNGQTMSVTIKSDLGGEVRVLANGVGRPAVCNVSGHASTYPDCP